ncbi:hypothetical protein GALL_548190 [mine drainage metagenome]|uniref:Uncharacterized protein n=1 Tax=mine drainage metagenome TaxID=410659 RepID=A0A1J5P776_9ZZZZ
MARQPDQRCNVDAHWTDQGAASAHGAAVVEQFLPFLQLFHGHFFLQVQCAVNCGERSGFAFVGLLERFEFPDQGIFRILGRDIEVTGFCAHAAVDAGFHVSGSDSAEILDEMAHRRFHPLCVRHVALLVVTQLGILHRETRLIEFEWVCAVNIRGTHIDAPLRSNKAPVLPRDTKTSAACMSLPKGNQISNTATDRMWTASSVS